MADAVDRAKDRVALRKKPIKPGDLLFHATVVMQKAAARTLDQRAKVGNEAGWPTDMRDPSAAEENRRLGVAGVRLTGP